MNQLKQSYDLTISLLAPLHIGSGRELLRDYDYVTHGGQTWIIDPDALLDAFVAADGTFDERILGRPAAEVLRGEDFVQGSSLFRYVLPGTPRSTQHGAVLREMYKDAFDRPYIPGSSVKGALRTLLAWHGFQAHGLVLDVGKLGESRSWAAQPVERALFGRSPNYDLLRALQIADSQPQLQETLRIVNAQVVTGGDKPGSPIEVEAVATDTVFHTTLTVDRYLHEEPVEASLRFRDRWQWLEELPEIARRWNRQVLESERNWFRDRKYDAVGRLYHQMLQILHKGSLQPGQFFLQIGWGGGWESKTIGAPLRKDKEAWEALLDNRRLSPARIRRKTGDAFPKSRRVMTAGGQVVAPLGWCLVEMTRQEP